MKNLKVHFSFVLVLFLLIGFTSCQQDEVLDKIVEADEIAPVEEEISLERKHTKNIEVYSADRKSKAIITVSADEELALKEFSDANFALVPIYELPEEDNGNIEATDAPALDHSKIPFVYEANIVQEDANAIGYQIDVDLENASRSWVYWGYLKTTRNCIRVNTNFGRNLVYYYYRNWLCGGWNHQYTATHYAGGWSYTCYTPSCERFAHIYWDNAYGGYSFSWSLYN